MTPDLLRYRSELLADYGKNFQNTTSVFSEPTAELWGRAYRHYLRDWLPTERDTPIAEVGCGNGKLLYLLKTMGFSRLSGVDISLDQVRSAQQVVAEVEHGDALAWIAARPGPLNLVFALDLIEHFTKNEILGFLTSCMDALAPGGGLVIQTPNAASPFGMQARYGDFTHEVAFTPDSLTKLLRLKGFTDIEVRELGPVPFGYSVTSTFRYFGWRVVRSLLRLWSLLEVGATPKVLTRNFIVLARRPQ